MNKKHVKQFGGKYRVFLPEELLNQIPEKEHEGLSERSQEIVDLLRQGFDRLTAVQKRVLLLLVDRGLSTRKASEVLGMHHSTFMNHVARIRSKLKKYVIQKADLSIYSTGVLNDEQEETNTSIYPGHDESY